MITLTENAAVKVKELLAAEGADDLALRVAVRPGGCSGFSYEMFFDGDVAPDDEQAAFGPDSSVKVVVDALRPMGVHDVLMPCTPERVWNAIQGAAQQPTVEAAAPHFQAAAPNQDDPAPSAGGQEGGTP